MTKRIVSVQDISCVGQCSLTVALPILSSMGIETAILPSSILSTHTGGFTNMVIHDLTDEMPKIIDHWKRENLTFDGIYTGYIGDARQFKYIQSLKELSNGLLIVDPAMADHGKLYSALNQDIVDGMKSLISHADVILPNMSEASLLLDIKYKETYSKEEIEEILHKLGDLGPRYSVITGVSFDESLLGAACFDKEENKVSYYFTKKAPRVFHGTGDVFSSVFVGSILNDLSVDESLKEACEFTYECILETMDDENHPYGVHFENVLKRI